MLKGNEIGPRTLDELPIATVLMLLDLIIAGNIFGKVAVMVSMSNRKSVHFQRQIDASNTSMKNLKISSSMQQKVRDFLIYTQAT
jgi:hypothetical protein